jgi:hypothetical protein
MSESECCGTFVNHVFILCITVGLYLNIPAPAHRVLYEIAIVPVSQGLQELAPSVLIVFPSQNTHDVLLAGK